MFIVAESYGSISLSYYFEVISKIIRHIKKIVDFSNVYTVPQFIIMYIIRLTSGLKHIKL